MGFMSIDEVRKKFKGKKSDFIKGYFDGYNNPKRSMNEVNNVLSSGKYKDLSDKTKDFVDGKAQGVEDREKSFIVK